MTITNPAFQFSQFCGCETEWHPEKVGKPTSARSYGPLDPFLGDICSRSPTSATSATPLLLSALHARAYTSIREVLSQVLQDGSKVGYEPVGAAKSIWTCLEHKKGAEAPSHFLEKPKAVRFLLWLSLVMR